MFKSIFVTPAILAATLALAFFLNPSPERHRTHIKEAIAERSQIAGALGVGHLTAFVSQYHSLGVASYTKVDEKITSVGVLGVIFVMD